MAVGILMSVESPPAVAVTSRWGRLGPGIVIRHRPHAHERSTPMAECIYDPDILIAKPQQLRHCACGQKMLPAQSGRHALVYRCDPGRCGRHTAHIDDIEEGLVKAYRHAQGRECWGKSTEEIVGPMYASLTLAWVNDGQVCADAIRFREPVDSDLALCTVKPRCRFRCRRTDTRPVNTRPTAVRRVRPPD